MISSDASFRVLSLCTARPGNRAIAEPLRLALADVHDWDALAGDAEAHGLEPLLLAHAHEHGIGLPDATGTRLKVRCVQHAHAAAARARALVAILDALEADGVAALVLKGAALAHLVYPSPTLRPMVDVDLLVPADRGTAAWQSLRSAGFSPSGHRVAPGYHHLQALSSDRDGATITVEIHTELLRDTAFVAPLRHDDLASRSQTFSGGGRRALTLGPEDMLWHVYAHAFVVNVLRPGIRLISIADVIAVTEAWADRMDWERLRRAYPRLLRALPRLGEIVPWSDAVQRHLRPPRTAITVAARGVSAATGWRDALSRHVWWPPDWWLDVRYGVDGRARRVWTRLVAHPTCVMLAAAGTARRRSRRDSA